MAMQMERGSYGNVPLDGIAFIVLGIHAGGDGKGQLVGRPRHRRTRHRRAARCDHRHRERRRRRSDGAAVGTDWKISRRGAGADPHRSQRHEVHGHSRQPRGHGRRRRHGDRSQPRPSRCSSTTRATRSRTASRSLTRRRATSTRSDWPGTMRAGRTTVTSRRSTGGVHNPVVDERPPTRLELALGHDRAPLIVLLILFPLVCWCVDRRHGARHVRPDDRRQRMDDDARSGMRATCFCCGRCGR